MLQYRTDLAIEAHELLCAKSREQTLSGVDSRTVFRRGCSVTSVRIDTEGAARQLGKPRGRYVTLDLSPLQKNADDLLERAVAHIARFDILAPDGIMIAESPAEKELPKLSAPYRVAREYRYGRIKVTLYRRDGEETT